jgi:hypothetical protein
VVTFELQQPVGDELRSMPIEAVPLDFYRRDATQHIREHVLEFYETAFGFCQFGTKYVNLGILSHGVFAG